MSRIQKMIEDLAETRKLKEDLKSHLDEVTSEESDLRNLIQDELKLQGFKSGTSSDGKYRVAITARKSWKIYKPEDTLKWIQENAPDPEAYLRVDKTMFNRLAGQVISETGEIPPGSELEVTESITFTEINKQERIDTLEDQNA